MALGTTCVGIGFPVEEHVVGEQEGASSNVMYESERSTCHEAWAGHEASGAATCGRSHETSDGGQQDWHAARST